MSAIRKNILVKYKNRWQLLLWLEVFLYALGPALLIYFLTLNLFWSLVTFLLGALVMAVVLKPWEISLHSVSSHLDQKLETAEYSTGLLLIPSERLPGLARLQQQRVAVQLEKGIADIKPDHHLPKALGITGIFIVLGFLLYQFGPKPYFNSSRQPAEQEEVIVFRPTDSVTSEVPPPVLESQQVTINYPAYTGLASRTTTKMDIEAVEGSRVSWQIEFDGEVKTVQMESTGSSYEMDLDEGVYSRSTTLRNSGFYNFKFTDTLENSYMSDLFAIEVTKDRDPVIEVPELKQFSSYNFDEEKKVSLKTRITDDYGIGEAFIIATVSKGTGESVKFREERLEFNESVQSGSRNQELSRIIDLDQLKMEPGDELYFYIEATDLKQPVANRSRSETYFAVIKDTVTYGAGVEGSLGVDLMPDYFRSQRQLIIDTEKLIAGRGKIPVKEFNSTSNNLGFDQKALRLKYGQFMGDEAEGDLAARNIEVMRGEEDHGDEDPLAEYTHDHDGNNEHNLVEQHDHAETKAGENDQDPLEEYLHNHSDPEESTLFADFLKSKLRQALDIMWDAELHLRMYEPEKSLPFQYKALALIQEIKNSARIYVHRIGYDPPPIKEEVRLTGEIDEVSNFRKSEELEKPKKYVAMQNSVQRLEQLIGGKGAVTAADRELFEKAGNELAEKAIEEPGKHLQTLQQLKWLSEAAKPEPSILVQVQRGLLAALPKPEPSPGKTKNYSGEINELLLKELELNVR